jgi:hypothetical protein
VNSVRIARYVAGVPNYFRGVIAFDYPGVSGNVRQWGASNSSDGVFFEINGINMQVGVRKAGIDTVQKAAALPTDGYYHTYEAYLRNKGVDWMVDDVLVASHTVSGDPLCVTLSLPSGLRNANQITAVATSGLRIRAMSAAIHRIGEAYTRPKYYFFNSNQIVNLKIGPGTLHTIIVGGDGTDNNVVKIYDDLVSSNNMLFSTDASATTANEWDFNLDFYNGLTVGMSTGTPASLTIIYE